MAVVGPQGAAGPPQAAALVAPCIGIVVRGSAGHFSTCLVGSSTAGACQLSLFVPDNTSYKYAYVQL